MTDIKDKIIGCVIGLAIGDALGAPLEGLSGDFAREKIELITGKKTIDFWSEVQENLADESPEEDSSLDFMENKWGVHGIYTDDTQFMLCTIQSILETGKIDADRTRDVFAALALHKGPISGFGLFRGTGEVFVVLTDANYERANNFTKRGRAAIEMMVKKEKSQLCGQFSAGNGGAMRMGPIGAYYYNDANLLVTSAIESSLLTHRDPRGISAAVAMAIATAYLCNSNEDDFSGKEFLVHVAKQSRAAEKILLEKYSEYLLLPVDKDSTRKDPQANLKVIHQFSDSILWCSNNLKHGFKRCSKEIGKRAAMIKSASEDVKKNSPKEMLPTAGFVFCSVLTALMCASVFDDFSEAMQSILELGGDADTAGAMLGCLMGARLGYTSIPEKWRDNVLNANPLHEIAQHLAELATKTDKVVGTSCCELHSLSHLIEMECLKYVDSNDDE